MRQPETDLPYTPSGAWELIATLLENGHPLKEVTLKFPAGEKAFVMTLALDQELYIKFQEKCGKLVGRSFHYSYASRTTGDENAKK